MLVELRKSFTNYGPNKRRSYNWVVSHLRITEFYAKQTAPRYIGSTCIERVQVDPGSALSVIRKKLLYFLGILLNRLSATTTTIYGFNSGSSHPLGKIQLCCRIGDLKLEVTCYVIDADTSYNLLLGQP